MGTIDFNIGSLRGRHTPLFERFEQQYMPEPNSGCWLWIGHANYRGYGQIGHDYRTRGAHRVSWEIFRGEIPSRLFVLHRCDNPSCVNPEHLFLGTHQDNMDDVVRKKRWRGERNSHAKLTENQVRLIRADRRRYIDIAQEYGVTFGLIGHIKTGRSWSHVK